MSTFELTPKQQEQLALMAGPATHVAADGGSRSGKTFGFVRGIIMRALKAPGSSHAMLRFRHSHLVSSVVAQTLPEVMAQCFPGADYRVNRSEWYVDLGQMSKVWLGGLDEKVRVEKILGQEHATILLNECSQIPYESRQMAVTRLAQKVMQDMNGERKRLPLKMYYDLNPPTRSHWCYKLFHQNVDPSTGKKLADPRRYAVIRMNPVDNRENLPEEYLQELQNLEPRMRKRFFEGEYADELAYALFDDVAIEKWRATAEELPDMVRIVVGVDPSGADDIDNADNDEIGIAVGGLGADGNAYLLEDVSVKGGPKVWGKVATDAFERWEADIIVGEDNFGGAMVKHVIQTARSRTPYRSVKASRGKAQRAEPFSPLYEQGRVRHRGRFTALEDELCAFTSYGWTGNGSPNRADAWVWVLAELFPQMVKPRREARAPVAKANPHAHALNGPHGWMG